MNIYEILTFSYGNSQQYIVQAYDISQACMNNGINMQEVVSIKLVGSASRIDNTTDL